jgi:putative transposase
LHWIFDAKKRFGLCVLNYVITSNHVHLLIKDIGPNVIADSMQLIVGRTSQEYNQRKGRRGAFWEDRYHATAIEADEHLHRCLVYIDLNMVRSGVVRQPVEWAHSDYHEIQEPFERYSVVDQQWLLELCGFAKNERFATSTPPMGRGSASGRAGGARRSLVGSNCSCQFGFRREGQKRLGIKAVHRKVERAAQDVRTAGTERSLRERFISESDALRPENSIFSEENAEITKT